MTKEIGNFKLDRWGLDQIVERDVRITDKIIEILKSWDRDYE